MKREKRSRIMVSCGRGAFSVLSEEIRMLGLPVRAEFAAGVMTEGAFEDALSLNLRLHTGQRVYFLINEFTARDPQAVYRGVSAVPWEDYLHEDGYFSVTSHTDSPSVKNSRYMNLKAKDAVADRMRQVRGRRPDSGPERDRAVIHIHWKEDACSVYLDTSGDPLSKRGYRRFPVKAPMQEALAAALLRSAGWNGEGNLVNPMCGSGTLAIEAALMARDIAPGLLRENFAFMHLKVFDPAVWNKLREAASQRVRKTVSGMIIATDMDQRAVDAARQNARFAGVDDAITFGVCEFQQTPVPQGGGIVILNPEYGERMGEAQALEKTYEAIGDFFKNNCQGYRGYIFTGNPALAKKVGLRTKKRIQFFNGPIECRLLEYELYEGTRKNSAVDKGERDDSTP